jgi:VanZ family protein
MALIFILSSGSLPSFRIPIPHADKLAHMLVYGVLGYLLGRAAAWGWGWPLGRSAYFAIIVSSIYGMSDEWHQSLVPGRSVEFTDWAADTVGAALGQIPVWIRTLRLSRGRR